MSYDPTEHVISHGKKLSYCDTSNGTFVQVFGNFEIDPPDGELGESETTNDDTPDFGKSFMPGMFDWGTSPFKYRYGKTQYATVNGIYLLAAVAATRATAVKFWKITAPDGATWLFQGFIKKHKVVLGADEDVADVEGEIRATTKPVYSATGS